MVNEASAPHDARETTSSAPPCSFGRRQSSPASSDPVDELGGSTAREAEAEVTGELGGRVGQEVEVEVAGELGEAEVDAELESGWPGCGERPRGNRRLP
ncbi:hypothetical protein E2562_032844 [Oryza meyeriana var. granulata]|uniref:DUF834 domain-containing protein n=1 Tax=Oryza meyeriana var. granulata TaxID=110450 RepID=A0A6G1DTE3_9ORYZ|nr:hypothetical protein E2562_032844 [Oryza meyeriana var. granulata]